MAHSASDFSLDSAAPRSERARAPTVLPEIETSASTASKNEAPADELTTTDRLAQILGRLVSPWLVSFIVHMSLLLVLALIVWQNQTPATHLGLTVELGTSEPEFEMLESQLEPDEVQFEIPSEDAPQPPTIERAEIAIKKEVAQPVPGEVAAPRNPLANSQLLIPIGVRGGGLEGRSPDSRAKLVETRGGNAASEAAVARGLAWLADHQLDDGSWRLNHHLAPGCNGLCRHPGNVGSTTAATALALLPFLGAGHTHEQGKYQDVVRRGIYYLGSRMRLTPAGGDLQEGTMYAQALATIALCEAYVMSEDEGLREFCQAAIDFIVNAQHSGGGWRYFPGQAGDTTSFGWQLMALKSGQLGRMRIPSPTFTMSSQFLDSVQANGGANYGYQRPEINPTNTAIGLLSRMYLGWNRERPALQRGVDYLADLGPSANNMYYNYYATQVLHHYDGPQWQPWNEMLRDHLIQTQAREGHESGSWYFEESHTKAAGRLYNTAMAIMILEVYYRHMPLYTEDVWKD